MSPSLNAHTPKRTRSGPWRKKIAVAFSLGLGLFSPSSARATDYSWNLDANGIWDTTSLNWTVAGSAPTTYTNLAGDTISLGDTIAPTAFRILGVAPGGMTTGGITFGNTGNFGYTLGTAGTSITLDNNGLPATISVTRGSIGGSTITNSNLIVVTDLNIVNNGAVGVTALSLIGSNSSFIDRATFGGVGIGTITFDGQSNTLLDGAIGGNIAGGIVKNGTGTVSFTGNASGNAFSGDITINNGVLSISGGDGTLGNSANNIIFGTNSSGTFRFGSSATLNANRSVILNGNGNIDLAAGATGVLLGPISGANSLLVTQTGIGNSSTLQLQNANPNFTGSVIIGGGTSVIGSQVSNAVFGSTPGAILELAGTSGSLANISGLTLMNGGGLTITQPTTGTVTTSRLATVPIVSNGGRFLYNPGANNGNQIVDNFGSLQLTGLTVFTSSIFTGPAAGTILNFSSIDAANYRGTLLLQANTDPTQASYGFLGNPNDLPSSTSVNIKFGNATNYIINGIVPFAAYTGAPSGANSTSIFSPAIYGSNGLRPLADSDWTNASYSFAAANLSGTKNSQWTGGTVYDVGGVNSLYVLGSTVFQSPGTITVTSGWTGYNSPTYFSGSNLSFGGVTGYFHVSNSVYFTNTSSLSGSAGIVVSGLDTVYGSLNFSNTSSNSFSGGLFINGNAYVTFTNDLQLGTVNGNINLAGGALVYAGSNSQSLGSLRTINIGPAGGSIGNSTPNTTFTIPGLITGSGQLQIGGQTSVSNATVSLTNTNANTYTGGTLITNGILEITNSNQLGSGAILLNGGTLQAGASLYFSVTPSLIASSSIDTQSNTITLGGGLQGLGDGSVLTKIGTGNLVFAGDTTYSSSLNIGNGAGTVTISGNGKMPELGAVTIGNDAVFSIDNSATNISNRTGRATSITLTNNGNNTGFMSGGGTLNITTNSATDSFVFGALSATGGTSTNPSTNLINISDSGSGNHTITFSSLVPVAQYNTLTFQGTNNFGSTTIGGTRVYFTAAPTLVGGLIPNAYFSTTSGITFATYDSTLGIIAYNTPSPQTGLYIDNVTDRGNGLTVYNSIFTTASPSGGNTVTTAYLGAKVNSLILSGSDILLSPGANSPQQANGYTAADTLVISSGILSTSGSISRQITAASGNPILSFGNLLASVNTSADLTIGSGVILSGSGGLNKQGTANLIINGTNNLGGDYNIALGGLISNSNANIGSLTSDSGTSLIIGTGTSFTIGGLTNTTAEGNISGGGSLVKTSTSILTLTGTNSYAGGTTIESGGISVDQLTRLGTGALTLNGGTLYYTGASATLTTNFAVGISGGTLNVSTPITTLTFSSTPNATGTLTKDGAGTLQLASGSPWTTTTSLNIQAGTFDVNGNAVTVGNLSGAGGNLNIGSTTFTINQSAISTSTTATTISGNGNLNVTNGTLNLTSPQTIQATISGSASLAFNPTSNSTLTLSGNNTYSGGTTFGVYGGAGIGASNALGTGAVTFTNNTSTSSSTPTIQFGLGIGGSATIPNTINLSTTPAIQNFIASDDTSGFNQTLTLSGIIHGGSVGIGTQLIIDSSGLNESNVVRFTNPLNDFSVDSLIVQHGTLAITSNGSLGASSNTLILASSGVNGSLRFDAAGINLNRSILLTSSGGGGINTNGYNGTISGNLSGLSDLQVFGGGVLTFNSTNSLSGSIYLSPGASSSGGIVLNNQGTFLNIGSLNIGNGSTTLTPSFTLDNTGSSSNALNSRLASGASVNLSNGLLQVLGNNASTPQAISNSSSALGALTIASGTTNNQVNLVSYGAAVDLYFSILSSIPTGAGLLFSGTNLGSVSTSGSVSHIFFSNAPTLVNGAIPNAYFGSFGVQATYDPVRGVIAFTPSTVTGILLDNVGTDTTTSPSSIGNPITPNTATFITSGAAIAKLGATVGGLTLSGGSITLKPNIYPTGTSGIGLATGADLVINGILQSTTSAQSISATAASNLVLGTGSTVVTTTDLTILGSNVTIAGTGGLNKYGSANLIINGGTHTILGGLTINAGTVTYQNGASLPASNSLTVASGASFSMNDVSTTFSGLFGNGSVSTGSLTSSVLTIDTSTAVTTPQFFGSLTGSGSLTKQGTGVQILSGNSSSFSGNVSILNGFLQISADNNLGASTGILTLNGGGIQYGTAFSFANNRSIQLGTNGGYFDSNGLTVSLNVGTTGSGDLIKTGLGILNISANQSYTGNLQVIQGTVALTSSNQLPTGSGVVVGNEAGGTGATLDIGGNSQLIKNLTLYAPAGGSNTAINIGAGGSLHLNGDINLLDNTASPGFGSSTIIAGASNATLDLNNSIRNINVAGQAAGSSGDLQINSVITDGGINFTGALSTGSGLPGSLTLGATSVNTYSGGTFVNGGVLNVAATTNLGNGGLTLSTTNIDSTVNLNGSMTIASLASGTLTPGYNATVNIATGTTLTVNQSINTTYGGVIAGGGFTKSGSGTLVLLGTNTYTGTTTVTGGTLAVGNLTGGSLAAGSSVIVNGSGTLGGLGVVNGNIDIQSGGTVAPGLSTINNGIGTLHTGSQTWYGGGTFSLIYDNTAATPVPGTTHNQLVGLSGGSLTLNGLTGTNLFNLQITATKPNTSAGINTPLTYTFATFDTISGSGLGMASQDVTSLFNITGNYLGNATVSFNYTSGGPDTLSVTFVPVPEPASLLVIGGAGIGLLSWVRRNRRKNSATV
ncbi:autotransporter-associated beta strand repeat-containing protein [Telmatocola sphagniphila]|uniref:Autotransporter-associated beta strand repeat-containing protein n=1 Tax=Telmatocola sphagniphila TaxID=1123043 RepID=A0A8E6B273_9BACT|nr:autotransporter-associated beta strand repeat-containing protein [Telmatocola sphagniphila]QVL29897.1 autotransporter-associated beta strand repeat-containing protein [Telmatocola sphagniphila]